MVTTPHPINYTITPRPYSAISGAAVKQSDTVTGATLTLNRRQPAITSPDSENETFKEYDTQFRQAPTPETTDLYEHLLDAITTPPNRIQTHNPRCCKRTCLFQRN